MNWAAREEKGKSDKQTRIRDLCISPLTIVQESMPILDLLRLFEQGIAESVCIRLFSTTLMSSSMVIVVPTPAYVRGTSKSKLPEGPWTLDSLDAAHTSIIHPENRGQSEIGIRIAQPIGLLTQTDVLRYFFSHVPMPTESFPRSKGLSVIRTSTRNPTTEGAVSDHDEPINPDTVIPAPAPFKNAGYPGLQPTPTSIEPHTSAPLYQATQIPSIRLRKPSGMRVGYGAFDGPDESLGVSHGADSIQVMKQRRAADRSKMSMF